MVKNYFRDKDDAFVGQHFSEPDKSFAPVYAWVWNAPISKEETDKQLDEFVRLGIKAFYIIPEPKTFRPARIPTLLEPDYLTKEYFEAYTYAFEGAFRRGMIACIYDEGGWPSGGACGKLLLKHPELARQSLGCRKKTVSVGEKYEQPENVYATFINGKQRIDTGYVFDTDTEVEEYYIRRFFFDAPGIPDFPDLTRKESADAFIEMTHEGYKTYLKEYFGDKVFAVFTDEPEGPRPFPFRKELIEEYEKRYGESILPYLPALFKSVAETDEEAQAIIRWYDMSSEYYCKNFMLVQKEWCNENNLSFTGHLNLDHVPYGSVRSAGYHMLRALRCFDIPGIDVIWRQIFPAKYPDTQMGGDNNRFFPRYASSAAAQIGREDTISETFGVYGNITFEQMRWVFGFQTIRGITVLNPMLISYGREGFLMTGELPHFSEKHACYADLKIFNEYLERLSYITTLGERNVSLALYFPINDIWSGVERDRVCDEFEKAGFEMEESNLYFDVFDDDVMRACDESKLKKGVIAMGKARYTQLVITACKYMPEQTKEKLETFIKGGGRVYAVSGAPEIKGALRVADCRKMIPSTVEFVGDASFVRVYERTLSNGRMTVLFNQNFTGEDEIAVKIGQENVTLVDITEGKVRTVEKENGVVKFRMQAGETVALLYTEEKGETLCVEQEKFLDGIYTFRKTKQFVFGEMTYSYDAVQDEEKSVALGDWREIVGESFSGSGVYKTTFKKPENTKETLVLDLGKVSHSCEVFLNGKSLGVRVFTPYRYEIPSVLLQDENILEIRVSNTPANELQYTKSFDKWAKWQLSPYYDNAIEFDKDCLDGGLFGPVKLKY